VFWLGVYPQPFLDRMAPALERTVQLVEARRGITAPVGQAGQTRVASRGAEAGGGR
jgi:hypothetical protein